MKKLITAFALLALVSAGAAQAQTVTPAANPSANGVQNAQSLPDAKAGTQGTVKKHHHKKKSGAKVETSTDATVTK